MSDTFIPRRVREQTEREERLLAGVGACLEDAADLREAIATLVHSVVAAERALEMQALRCWAGRWAA